MPPEPDVVVPWDALSAGAQEDAVNRARQERLAEEQAVAEMEALPDGKTLPASSSTRRNDKSDSQYHGSWSSKADG